MVILETAAIGAAAYGAYRGGDATVRKAKQTHTDIVRETQRRGHRSTLTQKSKARQGRIAQLAALRGGEIRPQHQPQQQEATATSTHQNDTSGGVDERHKNVMAKLRESRAEEVKKSKGGTKKFANLFKKGKK